MWSLSSSVCNQQRNLGVIARMIATPMNREHTGRRQTNRQASELLVGQFSPLLCSGQSDLLTVITFINKVNYQLIASWHLISSSKFLTDEQTWLCSLHGWVEWRKKQNALNEYFAEAFLEKHLDCFVFVCALVQNAISTIIHWARSTPSWKSPQSAKMSESTWRWRENCISPSGVHLKFPSHCGASFHMS